MNGVTFEIVGVLTAKGSTGPPDQDDRVIAPLTAVQGSGSGASSPSVVPAVVGTVVSAQAGMLRVKSLGGTAVTVTVSSSTPVAVLGLDGTAKAGATVAVCGTKGADDVVAASSVVMRGS